MNIKHIYENDELSTYDELFDSLCYLVESGEITITEAQQYNKSFMRKIVDKILYEPEPSRIDYHARLLEPGHESSKRIKLRNNMKKREEKMEEFCKKHGMENAPLKEKIQAYNNELMRQIYAEYDKQEKLINKSQQHTTKKQINVNN